MGIEDARCSSGGSSTGWDVGGWFELWSWHIGSLIPFLEPRCAAKRLQKDQADLLYLGDKRRLRSAGNPGVSRFARVQELLSSCARLGPSPVRDTDLILEAFCLVAVSMLTSKLGQDGRRLQTEEVLLVAAHFRS